MSGRHALSTAREPPAAPAGTRPARRRWFVIAGPLSLLLPGLGQFYNVRLGRALILVALSAAIDLILFAALFVPPTSAVVLFGFAAFGATIALRVFAGIDAALDASRQGLVPLTRANRWFVYPAILLAYAVQSELLRATMAEFWGPERWKSYNIPTGTMLPTVAPGDHLLSWHLYYSDHEPERGDLAVFKLPRDNSTDYIKRIVGLPGDRVQMVGGILHINGKAVELARLEDLEAPSARGTGPVAQFLETMPGGRSHRIIEYTDRGNYDETAIFMVPPGQYFVLGDNRDNSLDSRIPAERLGVGFVPRSNLRDRPTVVYWSADWRRIGTTLR